jgi:transketolase
MERASWIVPFSCCRSSHRKIAGVEQSTGALGHGLSIAVGMAIAGKLDNRNYRVFCLMGDGELAEGSIWEASMAAAHYQLDNLIAIVDRNRLQIFGSTEDVMSLEPLKEKFEAFGFSVREVDGNDTDALLAVFQAVPFEKGKPSLVLANTIKGKGSATWKIRRNGIMAYLQKINYSRRCANLKLKERLFDMLPPLKKDTQFGIHAQILINRAKDDPNLMIVTSDSRGSGRVTGFSEQFPQQLIEVGHC